MHVSLQLRYDTTLRRGHCNCILPRMPRPSLLTRVQRYAVCYEYWSTNPLSLRERVGVRVKCLPLSVSSLTVH